MSFSTRNPFEDIEDNKIHVTFSISNYGKEVSIDNLYDDVTTWSEVLRDITAALPASFGYAVNVPHPNNPDIDLGIYIPDREPEPVTTIKDLLDD